MLSCQPRNLVCAKTQPALTRGQEIVWQRRRVASATNATKVEDCCVKHLTPHAPKHLFVRVGPSVAHKLNVKRPMPRSVPAQEMRCGVCASAHDCVRTYDRQTDNQSVFNRAQEVVMIYSSNIIITITTDSKITKIEAAAAAAAAYQAEGSTMEQILMRCRGDS